MKLEIIPTRTILYDKCENVEQLYDNFYFPLLIEYKELKKENKQFKDNWDKLKEWLESNWEESQDIWFVKIINKMQEIEQGSDK